MKTIEEIGQVLEARGLLLEVCGTIRKGHNEIRHLTCDSREAKEGTLFICKGAGYRPEYLKEAMKRGSIAYVREAHTRDGVAGQNCAVEGYHGEGQNCAVEGYHGEGQNCAVEGNHGVGQNCAVEGCHDEAEAVGLIVSDVRKAMAAVSAAFYEYQPGNPILTGITGTKGKTTTAWYLKAMLDAWQRQRGMGETGLISSVENFDGIRREEAVMTTPEAPCLHQLLANARSAKVPYVTMEVSSQALKYKRVRELRFQVGVFLNISEDHISPLEHEDFEDYFSAKLSMFRQTDTACVNLDSEHAERILKAARKAKKIVTFGVHPEADLHCSGIRADSHQVSFQVECDRFTERFVLGMKGCFNVENALAAIAAAYVYGVPVACMKEALAATRVPGRMETFASRDRKICGVVDYAHNRLSFERLFDAVFQEYGGYERIITVFGCPGGKALNRRRELGIIAGLFSDFVCITADDPGMECPEDIAGQVRGYVELTGCSCTCIGDREQAVRSMVSMAASWQEKTLVLLLGKGCEKYQRVGGKALRYPTDARLLESAIAGYDLVVRSVHRGEFCY